MPLRPTLVVLALAATAAVVPALAQAPVASRPIQPERMLTQQLDPARTTLLRERKEVFDIPHRVVILAGPAGWTGPVPDRSAPPSALTVQRTRATTTSPCTPFHDFVDLDGPRRNGFRLVGYDVVSLPPPAGYGLQAPAEALALDTSTRDTPTTDLAKASRIQIRPPLHVRAMPLLNSCISRYRLSLTLEGPRGIDPFAGVRDRGEGRGRGRGTRREQP